MLSWCSPRTSCRSLRAAMILSAFLPSTGRGQLDGVPGPLAGLAGVVQQLVGLGVAGQLRPRWPGPAACRASCSPCLTYFFTLRGRRLGFLGQRGVAAPAAQLGQQSPVAVAVQHRLTASQAAPRRAVSSVSIWSGDRPDHQLRRQLGQIGQQPRLQHLEVTDLAEQTGEPDQLIAQGTGAGDVEHVVVRPQGAPQPPGRHPGRVDHRLPARAVAASASISTVHCSAR